MVHSVLDNHHPMAAKVNSGKQLENVGIAAAGSSGLQHLGLTVSLSKEVLGVARTGSLGSRPANDDTSKVKGGARITMRSQNASVGTPSGQLNRSGTKGGGKSAGKRKVEIPSALIQKGHHRHMPSQGSSAVGKKVGLMSKFQVQ